MSKLRLTHMLFAFPSHSWGPGNAEHLPAPSLFRCHIPDERTTGVACITLSSAWHSITTHPSAGSSYLGHTWSPSGSAIHVGSSQTSVLVILSIQRVGQEDAEPQSLVGIDITGATYQFEVCYCTRGDLNTPLFDR